MKGVPKTVVLATELSLLACSSSSGNIKPDNTGNPRPAQSAPCSVEGLQCPQDTYLDNSQSGKRAYVGESKKVPGGIVIASGEGECRFTCRQLCPDGTSPHIEETISQSEGTTIRKYTCDALPKQALLETMKDGATTMTVLREIACQPSTAEFARGYCAVTKCDPGWVRASIRVELTGETVVQVGLEDDNVIRQQCGSAKWSIINAGGNILLEGETHLTCMPGKGFAGQANIVAKPDETFHLNPNLISRVAKLEIIPRCN